MLPVGEQLLRPQLRLQVDQLQAVALRRVSHDVVVGVDRGANRRVPDVGVGRKLRGVGERRQQDLDAVGLGDRDQALEVAPEQARAVLPQHALDRHLPEDPVRVGLQLALATEGERPVARRGVADDDPSPTGAPEAVALRNVVLITLDTTRADALGVYGQPLPTSPHIDRMAAEGTRFAQAVTASPSTLPSHATILTGKQAHP